MRGSVPACIGLFKRWLFWIEKGVANAFGVEMSEMLLGVVRIDWGRVCEWLP